MSEEYITQKMLDASISRLESKLEAYTQLTDMKLDAFMAEMKARDAEMRAVIATYQKDSESRISGIETRMAGIEGDIKAINARLDGMKNFTGWLIALTGTVVGIVSIAVQVLMK